MTNQNCMWLRICCERCLHPEDEKRLFERLCSVFAGKLVGLIVLGNWNRVVAFTATGLHNPLGKVIWTMCFCQHVFD